MRWYFNARQTIEREVMLQKSSRSLRQRATSPMLNRAIYVNMQQVRLLLLNRSVVLGLEKVAIT